MIKITQRPTELNIEYNEAPIVIDIGYEGVFEGEILGNSVSGIKKNRMIIAFLSPPDSTFMEYTGRFQITSIKSYDSNQNIIETSVLTISDEIERIRAKWDVSDNKYEDYDKSNKNIRVSRTKLIHTMNGTKRTLNDKNKHIASK